MISVHRAARFIIGTKGAPLNDSTAWIYGE